MARSITVLVTIGGETRKPASIEIDTGVATWEKFEAGNANNVFITKKGLFRKISDQQTGATNTELLRQGASFRVGVLRNFSPDTIESGQREGLSDEKGAAIQWKIDKIVKL